MKIKIITRDITVNSTEFTIGQYRYKLDFSYGGRDDYPWVTFLEKYIERGYKLKPGWSDDCPENDVMKCDPMIIKNTYILQIGSLKNDINNETFRVTRDKPPNFPKIYMYKRNLYSVEEGDQCITDDEIKLKIKSYYYKESEKFKKLLKEVQLFESLESVDLNSSREPIPEQVRFIVWRRDEGKCVKCGSNKGLEFDHIIPFSKGGSNTERNIQLLCEKCNREKSSKI